MLLELTPCPMPHKTVIVASTYIFYPPRSHRPLITVPPALTGAAITVLAFAETFIAAGAAVAFWFFFATEKELGPRGYERNENIKSLIRSSSNPATI